MRWSSFWQNKTEEWRFKFFPPLTNFLVAGSTLRARKPLLEIKSPILIDNSTLAFSITHETLHISTGTVRWGNKEIETGYPARICVFKPNDNSEIYRNVRFMPGIAHLARQQKLELCTSAELNAERFRQPVGRFSGYGRFDFGMFRDIRMRSIDGNAPEIIAPSWMGFSTSKEKQQSRLSHAKDPLYGELVAQLGNKNNLDAWHICTAERHGMFCFLTMDFKLNRIVKEKSHIQPFSSLRTKIMTPEELGSFLNLTPVDPILFSYHGARSPVRPNLYWAENKRRPRSYYRRPKS